MNGSQLRAALRGGQRVYGTLIISTSPQWPAAVRATGVDFVFIDTEHITIDRTTLAWMCQTYRALGLAPVVRIPEPDPYQATVALDDGACGVLAPYVETPGQAKRLRGAVKLRPLKGRLLEGVLNGERQLASPLAEYVDERCSNNVLMINIESVPAIEALDEILSVPGIDAVQVGPHDLSCSLGVPEQYEDPRFEGAIQTIIAKSRAHGVGVGVHFWDGIEHEIRWVRSGANLIVHSGDIALFANALRASIRRFREEFGDITGQPAGSNLIV
ncbi:MAG TPA: aldolase/citrate lyase family protein [Blastocatellia bacterium]|nr:aldolase/citrate lyase family protein [Blastocatellia bacterium]